MTCRLSRPSSLVMSCLFALFAPLAEASPDTDMARAAQILDRYDRNQDRRLDLAEFDALRRTIFNGIDRDQDGKIRAQDVAQAAQARGQHADGQRLMKRDTNRDGFVDWSEFKAQTQGFTRADRNSDGHLSAAELARLIARLPAGLSPASF
ncbi:EF-hand domain-containing protein [Thioclava sp. GXIMD4216]|uniref:EF-hand domain-containing protein n=1 Tax=Thioclava sp. GXIMD4216 TaxID=3131929 RepID=UPI0030D55B13